jgi:hypothetical protein
MYSQSQCGTERACLHAQPNGYPDTGVFHAAPREHHWQTFVKFRMNFMQKNHDLVE